MCVDVKNRIVTSEKYIFWFDGGGEGGEGGGYKQMALDSSKTSCLLWEIGLYQKQLLWTVHKWPSRAIHFRKFLKKKASSRVVLTVWWSKAADWQSRAVILYQNGTTTNVFLETFRNFLENLDFVVCTGGFKWIRWHFVDTKHLLSWSSPFLEPHLLRVLLSSRDFFCV